MKENAQFRMQLEKETMELEEMQQKLLLQLSKTTNGTLHIQKSGKGKNRNTTTILMVNVSI